MPANIPLCNSFKLENHIIDGYDIIANNLLKGIGFSYNNKDPTVCRAPAYPIFLAANIYVKPFNYYNFLRIAHIILDSITALFIFYLSFRLFQQRTISKYCSLFYVINPVIIYYVIQMCSEIFTNFFIIIFVLSLIILLRNVDQIKGKLIITCIGISGGILCLNKSIYLLVLFGLWSIILIIYRNKKCILNYAFVLLIAIVTVIPWTIRNYKVTRRFIPVQTLAGFNFWYDFVIDENRNDALRKLSLDNITQTFGGGPVVIPSGITYKPYSLDAKTDALYDSILIKEALRFIMRSPLKFLLKIIDNIFSFWYFAESPLKMALAGFFSLVFIILSLRGAIKLMGTEFKKEVIILISIIILINLIYSPVMGVFRYSLVVYPLLSILFGGNFIKPRDYSAAQENQFTYKT